jgi:hypothetical protein
MTQVLVTGRGHPKVKVMVEDSQTVFKLPGMDSWDGPVLCAPGSVCAAREWPAQTFLQG